MQQIIRPIGFLMIAAMLLPLGGCKMASKDETTPPTTVLPQLDPTGQMVKQLALGIIVSSDSIAERDAIEAFRKYQSENSLGMQTAAIRLDNGTAVASGSAQPYKLRVDVVITKGGETVYTFSFVPHDNANLAMLGK